MDRTERFYKIDQLLQGGRSVAFVKFGPDVEVIEPEALRRRVADALAAASKRYT